METEYSTNERAGHVLGFRPTGVIPFDQPCELGFICPVCRVPSRWSDGFDERLEWSEYEGFLWCSVCDKDYPSALCVDLEAEKDLQRPWVHAGIDDAIKIFLDCTEDSIRRSNDLIRQQEEEWRVKALVRLDRE